MTGTRKKRGTKDDEAKAGDVLMDEHSYNWLVVKVEKKKIHVRPIGPVNTRKDLTGLVMVGNVFEK